MQTYLIKHFCAILDVAYLG